jgi:hypothetical protein
MRFFSAYLHHFNLLHSLSLTSLLWCLHKVRKKSIIADVNCVKKYYEKKNCTHINHSHADIPCSDFNFQLSRDIHKKLLKNISFESIFSVLITIFQSTLSGAMSSKVLRVAIKHRKHLRSIVWWKIEYWLSLTCALWRHW